MASAVVNFQDVLVFPNFQGLAAGGLDTPPRYSSAQTLKHTILFSYKSGQVWIWEFTNKELEDGLAG